MSGASLAKFPADLSKESFETFLFCVISLDSLGRCVLNLFPSMTAKYVELLEGPIICLLGIKCDNFLEAICTSLDTVNC
jgi:putative Mn2+ efflux pump MntP